MKIWKDPEKKSWGIDYRPGLTDEFEQLIELAKEKIRPFSHKEISRTTYYFKVKREEVSREFDCCDDKNCIKQSKKALRKEYGKGTHIIVCYYDNDGDHEHIELCSVCGKPLNEWLTWCSYELEYLEQYKPWTAEFLSNEGFLIGVILNSTPTMDSNISDYAKHQKGKIIQNALQSREKFFQRIVELAQAVIKL